MYRKLFLICFGILFTLLSVNPAVADYNQDLDNAKTAEYNQLKRSDRHYAELDHAGDLLRSIEGTYNSNQKAISDGKKVTLVGALGVSSLPSALSTLVSALGLNDSINDSSELLSAYETAIGKKQSTIQVMKDSIVAYNRHYNTYLGVYELHMGSPSHTLSSSSPHKEPYQKVYSPLDYYLPTFSCAGKCGTIFNLPSEAAGQEPGKGHGEKCGTANDYYEDAKKISRRTPWYNPDVSGPTPQAVLTTLLSRSVEDGCGVKYFTCQNADYHAKKTCGKWVWENNVRKERCAKDFRDCLQYRRDHRNAWWSTAGNHSDTYESGSVNSRLQDLRKIVDMISILG